MPNLPKRGDEIVPGYKLVRRLGSGSSGEVWVARASGGVMVAIKVVNDLQSVISTRELSALKVVHRVKHPNLCPIFGVWFIDERGNLLSTEDTDVILVDDEQPIETIFSQGTLDLTDAEFTKPARDNAKPSTMVIAMGLGDRTLFDRLNEVRVANGLAECNDAEECEPGGLDPAELLPYLAAAASAIDELNLNHDIYHCDLKPQNILLVGGQAQVCDFGLARQVFELRRTMVAMGTPAYGAPEMLFDRTYSKTLDQYSLAVTYYQLRTGRLPFKTLTHSSILRDKANGDLDLSYVSPRERDVLAKAASLNPDGRYGSSYEFVTLLTDAALNQRAAASGSTTNASTAKWIASAAVLVIAIASVIGWRHFWPTSLQALLAPGSIPREESTPILEAPVTPEILTEQPPPPEALKKPEPIVPPIVDPPKPTANQLLSSIISDTKSLDDRIAQERDFLESATVDSMEFDRKLFESLVSDLEQIAASIRDSAAGSAIASESSLRHALAIGSRLNRIGLRDESLAARLAVAQLTIALRLFEIDEQSFPSDEVARVRSFFKFERYAAPTVSFEAALALAESWQPQYANSNWDPVRADEDMRRVERLSKGNTNGEAAIHKLLGKYLIVNLQRRIVQSNNTTTNDVIARVARRMRSDPTWSDIAPAALWLVADAGSLPLDPIRNVPPDNLPDALIATYLLGSGLNAFYRKDYRTAFGSWENVATDTSLIGLTTQEDRHRVASLLLDWLIEATGVSNQEISRVRYGSSTSNAKSVLDVIEVFGKGNTSINGRLRQERILWSVADKQYVMAADRLRDVEMAGTRLSDATPQLGRAVFDLSSFAITTDSLNTASEAMTSWSSRMIEACLAQSEASLFGRNQLRTPDAMRKREELFARCYRPAMDQFKSSDWSYPINRQSFPAGLDEALGVEFCEHFNSLANDSGHRKTYDTTDRWLNDIEFSSLVTGSRSNDAALRGELFYSAAISRLRRFYEGQSDVDSNELIKRLESYRAEAIKLGTTAPGLFIEALIASEKGIATDDRVTAIKFLDDAIDKFTRVFDEPTAGATPDLLAMALCYRARTLSDKASYIEKEDPTMLYDLALADARRSVEIAEQSIAREDALAILSRTCILVAHRDARSRFDQQAAFVDEALRAIDEAVVLRENDSLDYTNLALIKLHVHWVDTLVSVKQPRFVAAKQSAIQWMSEISKGSNDDPPSLSLRAESTRLRCDWHFRAAGILDQTGDAANALKHVEKGFQIASSGLDPTNQVRHLITLAYVEMKGRELQRTRSKPLLMDLKRALREIKNPSPRIRLQHDFYLGLLTSMEKSI